MTARRAEGTGTITETADGRFWARLPRRHQRRSVGVFDSEEEAGAVLSSALKRLDGGPVASLRLAEYGNAVLDQRARSGHVRGFARDRTRWRATVTKHAIGKVSILDLTEGDVRKWLASLRKRDGKIPNATTLTNALSLVRAVLTEAVEAGHRTDNPAMNVRVAKAVRRNAGPQSLKWTFLRPLEIDRVLTDEKVPLASRLFWAFAIFTGLRPSEQVALRWDAIDFDRAELTVERSRRIEMEDGSVNETTKNGKSRTIALLPPAVEALRAWQTLAKASGIRSHLGIVFPAPDGGCHADGYDAGWRKHVKRFGFGRRVRWYDASRHTHASHLAQGTWVARGWIERRLYLEEIKEVLGHGEISVTERYAHLAPDSIRDLVTRPKAPAVNALWTEGTKEAPASVEIDAAMAARAAEVLAAATSEGPGYEAGYEQQPHRGIEPRTYGLRNRCSTSELVWRGPAS